MDTLSSNTLSDSDSLSKLVEELQKSKADLEAKRHTEATLARLISLMRWQNNDTLQSWVDRVLDELVSSINGIQASLYIYEKEAKNEFLSLCGAYAFDKNRMQQKIPLGEGVIGQVAKSRRPAYFGIETTFDSISSTTVVSVRPRSLRVQPLMYNDILAGVLEIASVREISLLETDLLLQISENIAANLLNIRTQEETRRLYNEMQIKSEALISQEEEMRQNVEELQATQEEMRRVQRVLQDEAERNKILLESMRDGVMTIERGLFTECNLAAVRILGCENKEEILNKGLADFSAQIQNSGRATIEELPERIIASMGEGGTSFEWKGKRKNGEEFDCELYLSPFDYQGSSMLLAVVRDISDQKKNEARLLEQQQQMQIAQSIARMGSWQLDLRSKNRLWTDSMYQIYNVSPDVGPLDFETLAQMTYFEDRDLFRQSYADLVNYGSRSNVEYRILPRGGDVKWVRTDGFAVRNDKGDIIKVYGLVQDITEQKEREMEVIEKNSELAAREEEMRQNLEQLEATQAELQTTLKRANSLFDNSGDAIIILNQDYIEDVNPAGLRLFGVEQKDLMLRRDAIDFAPEYQSNGESSDEYLKRNLKALESESEVIFEWTILKPDYEERATEIRITNLDVDDRHYKQAIMRDVTDRKKQEKEIQRQKQMLDAVLNCNTDNIMLLNSEYKVELVNDTFVNIYKESNIDLTVGMSIFDLIKPEQYDAYKNRFERAFNGETYVEETFYTFQDIAQYSEVSRFPVKDSEGNVFGIGIVSRDITPRKMQEFELKRRSEQMETAQEIAKMGSWEYSNITKKLTFSGNLHILFGLAINEISNDDEFWRKTVIVEDLGILESHFEELKNNGISFDKEIRLSVDDDKLRWLRIAAVPEYGELKKQIGYICFAQDITEVKTFDLELTRQQLTLNQILNTLPQSIFWKDINGVFLGVNQQYLKANDLDTNFDVKGKTDYEMPWAQYADRYLEDDRSIIKSLKPRLFEEEQIENPDGSIRWLRISKFPLLNESGIVYGIVGSFEDITQNKNAELNANKFRVMADNSHDLITLFTYDGQIEYLNPTATRIIEVTGINNSEINFYDLIASDSGNIKDEILQILKQYQAWKGSLSLQTLNSGTIILTDAEIFVVKDTLGKDHGIASIQRIRS